MFCGTRNIFAGFFIRWAKEYLEGQKREDCKKLTGRTARLIGEIIERAIAV